MTDTASPVLYDLTDGVALVSDIYRPRTAEKTPTILLRIPFSSTFKNRLAADVVGEFWASRGYVVVLQGTRGRYKSGGEFYPLLHERDDGLETMQWLTRQAWFDGRLGIHTLGRKYLRKVFPDHWSFLLGEICLYSFVVLILTGVYLTLFFHPSMNEVTYHGSYVPLNGVRMSEAYASTLDISFDVRGGLLMRQVHHWAALVFIAGMLTHMMRHFFTGSFRKPREVNWVFGWSLLLLALFEGLFGYSLPDDLLSGTGMRFVNGALLSVPVVGTYLSMFLFGGEYPGHDIVARFYSLHILVIPGIMAALVVAHLILVVYHKHTQFAGPGRTERNVVGTPFEWQEGWEYTVGERAGGTIL